MTELLYYNDAYTVQFQANIVERIKHNGLPGLILDRTHFYPTSGGQPHDIGLIDDIPVQDVFLREGDGAVVHLLTGETQASVIEGIVDWRRRFDHMQQHSGQHILSQAFVRQAGAATESFHMGVDSSTLDLDIERLTTDQIGAAERLANEIVWQNRPLTIQFVAPAEAQQLPLRKLPDAKDGLLRLVAVDSFDLSACGGTHVAHTGEVGQIKVVKTERQKGKCRVEFLCGGRALADYDRKNLILERLSNEMTTGYWEVENSFLRLRDELKQAQHSLKKKTNLLLQIEAQNLLSTGTRRGEALVVRKAVTGRDPLEMRRLAGQLTSHGKTVALIGLAGEKALLIFACSDDIALPVNQVLNEVLPLLGNATGGGSAKYAQGGGPAANEQKIAQALLEAEKIVGALLLESQRYEPGT